MKKIVLVIFALLLPLAFVFAGCDGQKPVEIRISDGYVQWSTQNENNWANVISIDEIKNMLGQAYKGDVGETGPQGQPGINGREVEFRSAEGYIQWHYVGSNDWINLIAISELQSSGQGLNDSANPQSLAFYPLDDGTYGVGVGYATQLSKIVIPATYCGKPVTHIVDRAFERCGNMKELEIPDTIKSIGYDAFYGTVLKTINFTGTISDWLKIKFDANHAAHPCWDKENDIDLYINGRRLENVSIPNDITEINEAFLNCKTLKSVTFEENSQLTTISAGAFSCCTNLTSITIPSSITTIGASAFYGCNNLTSITIPSSVTSIDDDAFRSCYALVEVYNLSALSIAAGSNEYGGIGYYAKIIHTSVEEPSRIVVENNIAYYVDDIEKIALTVIDKTASSIVLANDCTSINQYAFSGCSSLTNIIIPNSVTSIGDWAFSGCTNLTSIVIPNSVTNIGGSAFSNCRALAEVYNLSALSIEAGSNKYGYIGCYAKVIHTSVDEPSRIVVENNIAYYVDDIEKIALIMLDKTLSLATLASDCTSINQYAFSGCSSLTNIIIPNSVTSIGGCAFFGCSSLTSVIFENVSGWKVGSAPLSSSDLSNPSIAAAYLTTHSDFRWTKS